MLKKFAATLAATTLLLGTTAAQASSADALSLRNAPVAAKAGPSNVRANTQPGHGNQLIASPLFFILGIVAVVGVLEITGAINIFDDEPDSP